MLCIPASAQQYLFDFQEINVKDGLPARQVYDISQDKDGFIWLSTRMGIHRFDGYSYKSYDNSYLKLPNRNPEHIVIDQQNCLWYGQWNVLKGKALGRKIDLYGDSLSNVSHISKRKIPLEDIYSISSMGLSRQDILLTTKTGILYDYNSDLEEICRIPGPFNGNFNALKTEDGNYWVCNNLKVFQIKKGAIQKELSFPFYDKGFVNTILTTKKNPVFEIKVGNGFVYQTIKGNALSSFQIKGEDSKEVKKILQIAPEYTVYIKQDSLIVRDTLGNLLFSREFSESMLPRSKLNIFLDQQSNLWISTQNGLFKLSRKVNPFTIINAGAGTRGILKDSNQVWLSGNLKYLMYDVEKGTKLLNPFPSEATYFLKDERGHILIGTWNGVFDYTPDNLLTDASGEDEQFKQFSINKGFKFFFQNPVTKNYWGVGMGAKNNLFEGYIIDLNQEKIGRPILPDSLIGIGLRTNQFFQGVEGIWLVTNQGLFLIDASSEQLVRHYSKKDGIPVDDLNYIYRDSLGIFWLASNGGGLIRWNRECNHIQQFTTEQGLSNDRIYAISEDDFGTLWLSSDFGLMAFDKESFTTKVYMPENGIALEEFNTASYFKDQDGTLYFGGPQGITGFHPRDLHKIRESPRLLKLMQVRVLESEGENFKNITPEFLKEGKLKMRPNDRIMDIDVALLDYKNLNQNQFAYRIEGYQEQWIHTQNNTISLFGLPYGHYNLVIKARGSSGGWNPFERSIPLHIQRPYYLQTWFIVSMILLGMMTIWIGIRFRLRSLKKEQERLEKEVEKRTQTIAKQAEALKVLDKAKTRFFSNITHEFRTPLTLITGPLEQIISETQTASIRQRAVGVMKHAQHLLELINQLLDLAKMEGGQMKIEATHGDIITYTQDLVKQFQPLAENKQQKLSFIRDQKHWKTNFDEKKWHKIVYNLLSNAIKFTPEAGSIHLILINCRIDNKEFIELEVKDTGIGIEPNQLEKIFDRFHQVDSSNTRVYAGTGIGLALIKELIELQGGSISVRSELNKGTTFYIKIPVLETNTTTVLPNLIPIVDNTLFPELMPEKLVTNTFITNDTTKEKLKVLIIEDNDEMRAYIRGRLESSIYEVIEASNGIEGIEKAQTIIPDLIISDVMMPGKDGFQVTQVLRNTISTSHIPIILLTAKAALESKVEGLKRGADAYLTKPFNFEELATRIQKLIETRQLLQQRFQKGIINLPKNKAVLPFEEENEFIKEVRAIIDTHLNAAELNGAFIGQQVGVSRMQLHRKLKALINQSATELIKETRLQKAHQLLLTGNYNISEVAYRTGFNTPAYFSSSFKQRFGISPSDVVKEVSRK